MAAHPVDLINSALVKLRQGPITVAQYNAENTEAPTAAPTIQRVWLCKRIFLDVLPRVLRDGRWSCVTTRATLARDPAYDPPFGLANRFNLPADYVRLVSLSDGHGEITNDQRERFRIESVSGWPSILADVTELQIRYVYLASDLTAGYLDQFDGTLRNAVVAALQAEYTYAFTSSASLTEFNQKSAEKQSDHAQTIDSSDSGPDALEDTTLLDVRW